MTTTTILLDMDGPLAEYDDRAFDICSAFPMDIDHPDLITKTYMTDHVINPDHRAIARATINEPGFFRGLSVVEGARDGVDELHAAGFDVAICTRPSRDNATCRDEKYAWTQEHFPELELKLVICYDKSYARGDVLLDDFPTLEQATRADWNPVIFPTPRNRGMYEGLPRWTWGDPVGRLAMYKPL